MSAHATLPRARRQMVPVSQRRRSPDAVRQRVLAYIDARPGVSRAAINSAFAHVNAWTLQSALKLLMHVDGAIRAEGRGVTRRFFATREVA